jgi:hypothetical protein
MDLIKLNENDLNWALETAFKKNHYTFDTWKKRSYNQRFMNVFIGDLAKNVVKRNIKHSVNSISPYLMEYDKERNDDFKKNDEYDLKIQFQGKNSKEKFNYSIEVKSSFEKYENQNLNNIKNKRNIIINKNNSHEKYSDFIFQVFYIPEDLDWFKDLNDGKYDYLSPEECKIFIANKFKKEVKIYLCGFVCSNEIKYKEKIFDVENKSKDDKKRQYLQFKLSEANDLSLFESCFKEYHSIKCNEKINKQKNRIMKNGN